jgi:hypothetical protein
MDWLPATGGSPYHRTLRLNDDFLRTRSTFDQTVELVISDLDNAIQRLPLSYPDDSNWGRITKGAAMAMKSRMLLYAASPLSIQRMT